MELLCGWVSCIAYQLKMILTAAHDMAKFIINMPRIGSHNTHSYCRQSLPLTHTSIAFNFCPILKTEEKMQKRERTTQSIL